jgi:outer membrane protein
MIAVTNPATKSRRVIHSALSARFPAADQASKHRALSANETERHRFGSIGLQSYRSIGAAAIAQLSVPIYQGGVEYSPIRQSKESLAQQRLNLDQTRDQVRANTIAAWGQLIASKAQVASAQAQVTASNDVREEAKAGQRTTPDVLNAQQALVNARVALVTAQHDRVVASYGVLNSVGRLSPRVLNLATTVYDPSVHDQQVRDSWFGSRSCCID